MTDIRTLHRRALDVERISYVSLHIDRQTGSVAGIATDKLSGTEFDVRQDGRVWNVNDDDGVNHRSLSLKRALRLACDAQSEPS